MKNIYDLFFFQSIFFFKNSIWDFVTYFQILRQLGCNSNNSVWDTNSYSIWSYSFRLSVLVLFGYEYY